MEDWSSQLGKGLMYYVQAINGGQEKTPVPFAFHIHPNQSSTQASPNLQPISAEQSFTCRARYDKPRRQS